MSATLYALVVLQGTTLTFSPRLHHRGGMYAAV